MASPSKSLSKSLVNAGDTYSLVVGLVYVFNLILGTGVLTMPAVFAKAGYVLGVLVLTVLCFMSFLHLTFVVESMANANFIMAVNEARKKEGQPKEDKHGGFFSSSSMKTKVKNDSNDNDTSKQTFSHGSLARISTTDSPNSDSSTRIAVEQMEPELKGQFAINRKLELGGMTEMFLPRWFSILFFITIVLYMYGDLVIYNAMMAKSLREVSCTFKIDCNVTNVLVEKCWSTVSITRKNAYIMFLLAMLVPLIPLTYAGLTKNKLIQIATIILRWVAFLCMVGIAIKIFASGQAVGKPEVASLRGFPSMFGVCVYAFMCHHSLPSLLTPIADKTHLYRGIIIDYCMVLCLYMLITLTGIFAFAQIRDVYTLNFVINTCKDTGSNVTDAADLPVLDVFLPAYPVFTVFSSYTVIALTLINNLKVILACWVDANKNAWLKYSIPLIAIVPSLIVSMFTEDVGMVVSYVGSYTGSLIQYVFPTALVYYSRLAIKQDHLEPHVRQKLNRTDPSASNMVGRLDVSKVDTEQVYRSLNPFISYFQHRYWLYCSAAWWLFSVVVVTVNYVIKKSH